MYRNACQKCGTPTDAEYAGGLCPACLLKDGLETMPRLHCHACHDTLADDMRFCGHCGAPVPEEPAAQGDSVRAALEEKLQSQYRIVRLLGRGGMGSVYLARDLNLDREVAIKVVTTDTSAREIQDRRLCGEIDGQALALAEARAAAARSGHLGWTGRESR